MGKLSIASHNQKEPEVIEIKINADILICIEKYTSENMPFLIIVPDIHDDIEGQTDIIITRDFNAMHYYIETLFIEGTMDQDIISNEFNLAIYEFESMGRLMEYLDIYLETNKIPFNTTLSPN